MLFRSEKQYNSSTGEIYSLNEPWIIPLRTCNVCGNTLSDESFARAFYYLERKSCSIECASQAYLSTFACCNQAKLSNKDCVCVCVTECPTHGEKHYGTHE